jgi:glucosamine--fructose-6-phosphate aminotransferase (isomerizing)
MCGIVGYVGTLSCADILLDGLRRLEYRGYDSAGTAIIEQGKTQILRAEGKLSNLARLVEQEKPRGTVGIGHTRWATHGRPSEQNAHPHKYGKVAVVHNGIIENHAALRSRLQSNGHVFSSETDTEIVAHLVDDELKAGKVGLAAVQGALKHVEGAYAICVLIDGDSDRIFVARHDAPLILGVGEGEHYIASDIPAILNRTRDVIFLEQRETAVVGKELQIFDAEGAPVEREPERIMWDAVMAEKGGHKHFMLKEIHEQPRAVTDTIRDRISPSTGDAFIDAPELDLSAIEKVTIVACGTSWHAALVGKFLIEGLARVPVEVDLGSEYRYRDPLIGPKQLLVSISQSGETADTLAALREGASKGATVLSICNVVGSTIARESQGVLYTHAGPEIGVASTKAFTTQLAALVLLAVHLARRNGRMSEEQGAELIADLLAAIPELMKEVLEHDGLDQRDRAALLEQPATFSTSAAASTTRSPSRAR